MIHYYLQNQTTAHCNYPKTKIDRDILKWKPTFLSNSSPSLYNNLQEARTEGHVFTDNFANFCEYFYDYLQMKLKSAKEDKAQVEGIIAISDSQVSEYIGTIIMHLNV